MSRGRGGKGSSKPAHRSRRGSKNAARSPQVQGKKRVATRFKGTYEGTGKGFGFVIDGARRMYVGDKASKGAMGGDLVEVRETRPAEGDYAARGEITRIIERRTLSVIGVLVEDNNRIVLRPDNKDICEKIKIAKNDPLAKEGDKVLLRISRYPEGRKLAEGTIERVFGAADEFMPNYEALLETHGISTEYPTDAVEKAESYQKSGAISTSADRVDLTDKMIFTIDGAGAKDFDDAISLETLPNGNLLLGVHIADVSNYVKAGDVIDNEAKARGTSVYFVDKVVPMLPFALSDDLCSLREGVDRLTMTCDMEFTPEGRYVGCNVYRSVINSKRRGVYEEINSLLAGDDTLVEKYANQLPILREMLKLSERLTEIRAERGALSFETKEAVITLDEAGEPTAVIPRERGITERLIEEFMLVANEAVAGFLTKSKASCIYRIHEAPDPDKTESLVKTLSLLGIDVHTKEGKLSSDEYARIMELVKAKPHEQLVMRQLVRSMMRAKYSSENLGHFGLASPMYCHFTSPIRRYPDLLVHRAIGYLLDKNRGALTQMGSAAEGEAEHATECEWRSVECERDIESMYSCLYMSKFVGQDFVGVVSSVVPFGLFIELPNGVEGLLHITDLGDEYYVYDESTLSLSGKRSGKKFKFADEIKVRLAAADYISRRIDFALTD